ncbi:MAG: NAD(P)H-hydrate dehydratase [Alphaproteobacteria bacterium]|nr:NAD(P)H-hydrate dehydratase [Alphaproteobacteria bacterium]
MLMTCAETARADDATIQSGTAGIVLMQRAGTAVADVIRERYSPRATVVLCGPGHNGGDGFIVAEELRESGWPVCVACFDSSYKITGDAGIAFTRWHGRTIAPEDIDWTGTQLFIDGLFGTGLNRPVGAPYRELIMALNQNKKAVVAIDIPSGVQGDTGKAMGMAVRAGLTVTFTSKKPGHLLLPGRDLCGEVLVSDIGVDENCIEEIAPRAAENKPGLWQQWLHEPQADEHKYDHGHVLIFGGPMTGAARLAARAAQRSGAGLVTIAAPESAAATYAANLESVIVQPMVSDGGWKLALEDDRKNALLIGPGAGVGAATRNFVLQALATRRPCVLDADALTSFAAKPQELFAALHEDCVLTPHDGEFGRLFARLIDPDQDKLLRARSAARMAGCTVLLKGSDTVIAAPTGMAVINSNAPPWLAVAGAGDVLAGIIVGLLAQKVPAFAAACAACWLHGAAARHHKPGMIAEDIIKTVPDAKRSCQAG